MANLVTTTKLAHPFSLVKCTIDPLSMPFITPLAHHNDYTIKHTIIYKVKGQRISKPYGVPKPQRVLSPQLLLKRFDYVRKFLQTMFGLTTAECEGILRMLRFVAYYGECYAKAATLCSEPGCSKRTLWRAIKKLADSGVYERINRFLIREHAQISNLHILHKLLLVIARYLAEHGVEFYQKWLKPYLALPGKVFWGKWVSSQESIADPGG